MEKAIVKADGLHGEHVVLQPGKGLPGIKGGKPGKDGDVVLNAADGSEVLRVSPNGRCYVRGEEVAGNHRVYEAFRGWVLKMMETPQEEVVTL